MQWLKFFADGRAAAHARKHIKQLAAVVAHHGLHFAIHAGICPAGNFHAVLAEFTFKLVGLAHALWIQPGADKFKPRANPISVPAATKFLRD